jgi:hypothetical protein
LDIGQVLGSLIAPGEASEALAPEHLEAQPLSPIAPGAASLFVHVEAQFFSLMAPGAASVDVHLVAQQPDFSPIAPGAVAEVSLQHSLEAAQQSALPLMAPAETSWVLEQPTNMALTSTAERIENTRMGTFSFGLTGCRAGEKNGTKTEAEPSPCRGTVILNKKRWSSIVSSMNSCRFGTYTNLSPNIGMA